jgi:hypothetical protein
MILTMRCALLNRHRKQAWVKVGALLCLISATAAMRAGSPTSSRQIVETVVANESTAEQHRGRYLYLSEERSERTGGHLWKEWIAETSGGKVRMLVAVDGQSLNGDGAASERARLADIAAHPDAFAKKEEALKNDEKHAKQMLAILPKAFDFGAPKEEDGFLRIDFKPNPSYEPQSLEERVLHGMSGSILVDEHGMRLHGIEGRLPEDVSIGYGLIATIRAGSNFTTTRDRVYGNEWKTAMLDTDINGRAIFFKAIGKKEHAVHSSFKQLPDDITVPQAVEMLVK